MQYYQSNNVDIYNYTPPEHVRDWFTDRQKHKARIKSEKARDKYMLVEMLEMPSIITNIQVTPDLQSLFVLGGYKPRVRCYDLAQMSLKFDRCTDHLSREAAFLTRDYTKFVLLQDSQNLLEFHDKAGRLERKQLPGSGGLQMQYSRSSSQLMVTCASGQVVRFDAHCAKFLAPFTSNQQKARQTQPIKFTCSAYEDAHGLLLCGTNHRASVIGWDARSSNNQPVFRMAADCHDDEDERLDFDLRDVVAPLSVSSLAFRSPYDVGLGTSYGTFHLFDLRNQRIPLVLHDLHFRKPVRHLSFPSATASSSGSTVCGGVFSSASVALKDVDDVRRNLAICSVSRHIKILDISGAHSSFNDGNFFDDDLLAGERGGGGGAKLFTSIASDKSAEFSALLNFPGPSGLLLAADDNAHVLVNYLPALGPPPKWCARTIIDSSAAATDIGSRNSNQNKAGGGGGDQFVTLEEMKDIGLADLIGSDKVVAHMHGYWVPRNTYATARRHADLANQEAERQQERTHAQREREQLEEKERKKRERAEQLEEFAREQQLEREAAGGEIGDEKIRGTSGKDAKIDVLVRTDLAELMSSEQANALFGEMDEMEAEDELDGEQEKEEKIDNNRKRKLDDEPIEKKKKQQQQRDKKTQKWTASHPDFIREQAVMSKKKKQQDAKLRKKMHLKRSQEMMWTASKQQEKQQLQRQDKLYAN